MTKDETIKALIEAGDEATQGIWSIDWIRSVLRYARKNALVFYGEDGIECSDYGQDPEFIARAANSRTAIKALYAEVLELRDANQLGADILSKLKVGGKVSVTGDPDGEIFITAYDPVSDRMETTTRRIR